MNVRSRKCSFYIKTSGNSWKCILNLGRCLINFLINKWQKVQKHGGSQKGLSKVAPTRNPPLLSALKAAAKHHHFGIKTRTKFSSFYTFKNINFFTDLLSFPTFSEEEKNFKLKKHFLCSPHLSQLKEE